MNTVFTGSCVALITPFKDGKVNYAALKNLLEFQIRSHTDAILVCGTTGEPSTMTAEEKRAWLDAVTGVSLGSDAFFPFGDNIERARRSGVTAIVQPGGSIRDAQVIDTCNKYGIAMAFCGIRLFHH